MAGTIIESQLTRQSSAIRFALANEEDDAAIRRLLRENPMRGEISVSFEREPNYFHSTQIAGANDQTILAFEKGRLVCMGRCSIRNCYVNGEICRVGYLSDLRLNGSAQGRFDILRRGYQFFHELYQDNPADFYFTSVTTDNSRSLRFLQRGLTGMPIYEPLADFVTLLIPVPRCRNTARLKSKGIKIETGSREILSALVDFLNTHASRHNLSAAWDEEKLLSLQNHGLKLSDFKILMNGTKIIGCVAVWDQRNFKQIVIREYCRSLSFVRPFVNFAAALFDTPKLPSVGSTLAHGFLSPLATAPDDKESLLALIESSFQTIADGGIEFLAVGFIANDPRLAIVRNEFRCREYKNRFFQVRWPDSRRLALNNNLIFPEVALL
jgi:hypothetical protein